MDEQNKPRFSYNSPNPDTMGSDMRKGEPPVSIPTSTSQPTSASQSNGNFIPREELKPKQEFHPPTDFPSVSGGTRKPQSVPIMNAIQRLQYTPPKSGLSLWPFIIIFIVAAGMAALGYFYMDEIVQLIVGEKETSVVVEEEIPLDNLPPLPPDFITSVSPGPVLTENELKMEFITDARQSLADYFSSSGVYPANIQTDSGIFYCYRKNGAHYILGTVLDSGSAELVNDLDGEYYCGSAVKSCADPVYCEQP